LRTFANTNCTENQNIMSEKPRSPRPFKSNSNKSFSGRKPAGSSRPYEKRDRKPSDSTRSSSERSEGRSEGSARPSRPYSDRRKEDSTSKPYERRSSSSSDRPSYGAKRSWDKPREDGPKRRDDNTSRPYQRKTSSSSDRPSYGARKPWDKPREDGPKRRDDNTSRPYQRKTSSSSDRPSYGAKKTWDKPREDGPKRRDDSRPAKFSDRRDKPFRRDDDKRGASGGRFGKESYPPREKTGRAVTNYRNSDAFKDPEDKTTDKAPFPREERGERPLSRDRRPEGEGRSYEKREGSSDGSRRSLARKRDDNTSRPFERRSSSSSAKPAFGEKKSWDRPAGREGAGRSATTGRFEKRESSSERPDRRPGTRYPRGEARQDWKSKRTTSDSRPPREEKPERSYTPHTRTDSKDFFAEKLRRNEKSWDKKPAYKEKEVDNNKEIRLNKYIAEHGLCSRREADVFIASGVVSVNGAVVTAMGTKVLPGDEIKFNGERLREEKKVYLLLNKPKDYVTTMEDPNAKKTVMELIAGACKERIYPVGRLDRMSTGVLLFTNDGDLTRKLTHPSFRKKKVYHVFLNKVLKSGDMHTILTGVELEEDGLVKADEISYVDEEDKTQVGLEIHSGQNRIVRRMFESLGYNVKKLDRVYFAGLTKKGLQRGEWRLLNDKEIRMLKTGSYE